MLVTSNKVHGQQKVKAKRRGRHEGDVMYSVQTIQEISSTSIVSGQRR